MKSAIVFIAGVVTLCLFASCAAPKKNLFVLILDPDGKAGKIAIENKAGSQIIAQPGQVSEVKDSATPPTPPVPMDEKEINRIFGAALAAQPEPPVTFILYFNTASSYLTEASIKDLPAVFATVESRKSKDISVVGHTDTVGTKQKNYELSLKRAERVKEILVARGIDPNAIEIASHGEDSSPITTPDEVAEPRNRIVEVTVTVR